MKYKWIIVLVILIVIIMYFNSGNTFKVSSEPNVRYIYIKVNDNKYNKYEVDDGGIISLNLKKGDSLKVSLLENSIITCHWSFENTDSDSLKLLSHDKNEKTISIFKKIKIFWEKREGMNYDRAEFRFLTKKYGEYKIEYSYIPNEPEPDRVFDIFSFSIKVNVH